MKKKNALVVLYPGCIEFEVMLAAQMLAPHMSVKTATPDKQDYIDPAGFVIKPRRSLAEMCQEELDLVLVPGGDPRLAIGNIHLRQILQKASDSKAIIGAICAGPLLLGDAGILVGKRVAHGYQKKQFEMVGTYFEGAHLSDKPLEVDGRIITAKPNAYIDFALAVAETAGVLTEARRIEFLRRYYMGLNPGLMPMPAVNSVYFYCNDVFDSIGWYEKVFNVTSESHDGLLGVLKVGHQYINFCAKDDKSEPSTGGAIVNWWTEKLEQNLERIKSLGGEVLRGPIEMKSGRHIFHIRDPWGNAFGLEGWP